MNEGFYAAALNDETQCPNVEANQLIAISDVTARIKQALEGKEQAEFEAARKAVKAQISRECAGGDDTVRCDVVVCMQAASTTFISTNGTKNVRPGLRAQGIGGVFGGDPDNFEFPRYDYDVTYMRVYDGGKPSTPPRITSPTQKPTRSPAISCSRLGTQARPAALAQSPNSNMLAT